MFVFAPTMLRVEHKRELAEAIVVLGGESANRVFRTAELFHGGMAPIVVVSGIGDCQTARKRLILTGVPDKRIFVECRSRSTKENAEFTIPILHEQGVKRALVVTSWWHSRRALSCFKHFGPDISFLSVPAYNGRRLAGKPQLEELVLILIEYIKTPWYGLRYGIWSFLEEVASRRSQVAGRRSRNKRSQLASRRSQVTGP